MSDPDYKADVGDGKYGKERSVNQEKERIGSLPMNRLNSVKNTNFY